MIEVTVLKEAESGFHRYPIRQPVEVLEVGKWTDVLTVITPEDDLWLSASNGRRTFHYKPKDGRWEQVVEVFHPVNRAELNRGELVKEPSDALQN